jgi:hypothetical protein
MCVKVATVHYSVTHLEMDSYTYLRGVRGLLLLNSSHMVYKCVTS